MYVKLAFLFSALAFAQSTETPKSDPRDQKIAEQEVEIQLLRNGLSSCQMTEIHKAAMEQARKPKPTQGAQPQP